MAKKFPSLKVEYAELVDSLEENPEQGNAMSNNCYKIRVAIKSKAKGKSGGARVIAHVQVVENNVFLLAIYTIPPIRPTAVVAATYTITTRSTTIIIALPTKFFNQS